MPELGYTAEWVPQVGFVATALETTSEQAAERIIEGNDSSFRRFIPESTDSWTEFAATQDDLSRFFFYAGLRPDKEEQVAQLVDGYLCNYAIGRPLGGLSLPRI